MRKGVDLMASCWHFAAMPTLTIRNMPDALHEALKERAKKNRRSMNQEVIAELSELAGESHDESKRNRAAQMIALADSLRRELQRTLSAEEIRTAIDEGRR
jgi:plasmid stability protein